MLLVSEVDRSVICNTPGKILHKPRYSMLENHVNKTVATSAGKCANMLQVLSFLFLKKYSTFHTRLAGGWQGSHYSGQTKL